MRAMRHRRYETCERVATSGVGKIGRRGARSTGRDLAAEVGGPGRAARQLAHQVVDATDLGVDLGRADADEAHEVRVAAAERPVSESLDQVPHPFVLAALAAAIEGLDRHHALERRLAL